MVIILSKTRKAMLNQLSRYGFGDVKAGQLQQIRLANAGFNGIRTGLNSVRQQLATKADSCLLLPKKNLEGYQCSKSMADRKYGCYRLSLRSPLFSSYTYI
jgi:hypothetical protein